jgi:thioredoxin 1
MVEDKVLEKIKLKKLKEMLGLEASESIESLAQERGQHVISKPVKVTDGTFMEVVRKNPLVVVDCWAPWCGPCYMVAPVVEELARDHAGKILFGKLNVDENRRTAMQHQIMSIPTMLVFKNGKLVDRIIGAMPKQMLEPKITRYLKPQ